MQQNKYTYNSSSIYMQQNKYTVPYTCNKNISLDKSKKSDIFNQTTAMEAAMSELITAITKKEYPFQIELNKHYKPDEIVVNCGERAYMRLPYELLQLRDNFDNRHLTYRVQCRRNGGKRIFTLKMVAGMATFVTAHRKGTLFTTYSEARECADKLYYSKNFDMVYIIECLDGTGTV